MRIINDSDTRTFTDPAGDTLTLLVSVRYGSLVKREEMESKEALESLKSIGMSMEDARKISEQATEEERAAAAERKQGKADDHSADVRRFMLGAVAVSLSVGGRVISEQGKILQAYDQMDPASAAWVDEQVAVVWAASVPGDDDCAKPDGSLSTV